MKETLEAKKKRAAAIYRGLDKAYPGAWCALRYQNAWELLVATMLSAQCTDERVNEVTKSLFVKYPNPQAYLRVSQEELEEDIRPTGFFRNKARALREMAQRIVNEYQGQVPQTMEDLLTLHGVARKTANVVLGTAYGIASGIVVDTHVHRLAHRMGLSEQKEANKIEADLMELFPRQQWIMVGHLLIHHGRHVCTARKPDCPNCPVERWCPKLI